MKELINSQSEDLIKEVIILLANFTNSTKEIFDEIHQNGTTKDLLCFINHPNDDISLSALKAIGNILSDSDLKIIQAIIDNGLLGNLLSLSFNANQHIKQNIIWILGNLTGENENLIQQIIDHSIVQFLIRGIIDNNQEVRLEASYAINNIVHIGSDLQVLALVDRGLFLYVREALGFTDHQFLYNIIEFCQGALGAGLDRSLELNIKNLTAASFNDNHCLEALEELQDHKNSDICEKVIYIIETYFGFEDIKNPTVIDTRILQFNFS